MTFGVLTANIALKTKDPAAVQAVFPMAFLLISLTTAYQVESGVLRAFIDDNPTDTFCARCATSCLPATTGTRSGWRFS